SALRGLLAERMGRDPLGLRFEAGPQGKPFVRGAPRFNVAHSGTQALIALADPALGLEVGVDIEHRSEDIDIEALGELVFTPAERRPPRPPPPTPPGPGRKRHARAAGAGR
ncbi:4'-phosphopantetheinyl transferase family protein, partial [Variovorax sp. CT11-76]